MNESVAMGRKLALAGLVGVLLVSSGCSWFRSKTGYELSPESRPLEIPPELSMPASDSAMAIPPASVTRPADVSGAFTLGDVPMSAYGRIGIALGRIDGVVINERSQLLTAYTVSYEGETFMIRIAAQGDGTRVSAVSTEGRELGSDASTQLLGQLRQRLQ